MSHARYAKHTDQCSGPDPIVIDRIIAAGTVDAIPTEHHICNCERAYILKYVPNGHKIMKTSTWWGARIINEIGE